MFETDVSIIDLCYQAAINYIAPSVGKSKSGWKFFLPMHMRSFEKSTNQQKSKAESRAQENCQSPPFFVLPPE